MVRRREEEVADGLGDACAGSVSENNNESQSQCQ